MYTLHLLRMQRFDHSLSQPKAEGLQNDLHLDEGRKSQGVCTFITALVSLKLSADSERENGVH